VNSDGEQPVDESVDQALDRLILETSHLNALLAAKGWPTLSSPERHRPIEPFFADLTALIRRLTEAIDA
jgi:hypothetical protein